MMGHSIQARPFQKKHLLVWFPNYAWLATSAITPLVYYAKLKRENVEPEQRKILVTQETCRQIVSGTLSFLSGAFGIWLASKGKGDRTLHKVIWGTLTSCFGHAVIRPILGTDLFVYWMRRKGMPAFTMDELKKDVPSQAPASITTPEQRLQRYFNGVQARSAMKFSGWA